VAWARSPGHPFLYDGHLQRRPRVPHRAQLVALRLQSQLMVALPPLHDTVSVDLTPKGEEVGVEMRVVRRREHRLPVLRRLLFRCRATLRKRCCTACPQGEGGDTAAARLHGERRARTTRARLPPLPCSTAASRILSRARRRKRGEDRIRREAAPTPPSLFSVMFTEFRSFFRVRGVFRSAGDRVITGATSSRSVVSSGDVIWASSTA
jgi:hypothetical protein